MMTTEEFNGTINKNFKKVMELVEVVQDGYHRRDALFGNKAIASGQGQEKTTKGQGVKENKNNSQKVAATVDFKNGVPTVETISAVGKKESKESKAPAASVLPFGINVISEQGRANLVPSVVPEFVQPVQAGHTDPNINPALISGAISMIPREQKVKMETPPVVAHNPNFNPMNPNFASLYPAEFTMNAPSHEEEHSVMDITAGIIEKYSGKNSNVDLQKVIDIIGKNNLRFQFAEENGIIYVMVGDGSDNIPDPTISFSIDAGKNILNGKAKWFPCIMPVPGYGYEDYPIFELDCTDGGALSLYLQKKLPDNFRTIVGPEQLELNKYVDLVGSCYMDNQKRPSIMSRLKDAMKKGIFNQDKAGMYGSRYRISEVTSANCFKLLNDAPYRYGFQGIPSQMVEITFEENSKAHWRTVQ